MHSYGTIVTIFAVEKSSSTAKSAKKNILRGEIDAVRSVGWRWENENSRRRRRQRVSMRECHTIGHRRARIELKLKKMCRGFFAASVFLYNSPSIDLNSISFSVFDGGGGAAENCGCGCRFFVSFHFIICFQVHGSSIAFTLFTFVYFVCGFPFLPPVRHDHAFASIGSNRDCMRSKIGAQTAASWSR